MVFVLYLLALALWILSSFTLRTQVPSWLFVVVLALHVVVGLDLLRRGRRDLGERAPALLLFGGCCLALPPLSSMTVCLLASKVCRRAARRRGPDDLLARDLLAASRFWWNTGFIGVALGVFWSYGAMTAVTEFSGAWHPWRDPFRVYESMLSVPMRLLLVGCSVFYATLLWRTRAILDHDHATRDVGAETEVEEVPASDVVY